MKLNIVIVDDELAGRNVLKVLLKMYCPDVNILGEACNMNEAYEMINHHKPDCVFLDIQMPGGNGFQLLKKFDHLFFQVIFVTSYDKYAIEAIRCSALDYIVKPIEVKELVQAVEKLKVSSFQKEHFRLQVSNVMFNMQTKGLEKRILVHDGDNVIFVSLDEIIFLEGFSNYTIIQTINKKYTSSKNLGKYEEILEGFSQFFRINKGCIININYIKQYTKSEPCILNIADQWSFEVSRRKKKDLLEKIK